MLTSYFVIAWNRDNNIFNFTSWPSSVQLGVIRFLGGTGGSGSPVAYTPGNQLLALANVGGLFGSGPCSMADVNANIWTELFNYAAGVGGLAAFGATANSNVALDTFNFGTTTNNTASLFAVLEIAAAAGPYTFVEVNTTGPTTVTIITASGYTFTLGVLGGQVIVFEWGGGIAGQTYRIMFVTSLIDGSVNGGLPNPSTGWINQTAAWFPDDPGQSTFWEFSDVVPPPLNGNIV